MRRQYFMVLMALLFAFALTGSASAVTPECEVGVNVTYEFADDTSVMRTVKSLTSQRGLTRQAT